MKSGISSKRPGVTFSELRQLCEEEYPPDISRNLDIIFRIVLHPIVDRGRDSPVVQMKHALRSRLLLEYRLTRHVCGLSALMKARREATPTSILALLYPYRPDYHALIFPVANVLAERGVRTTVLTSRRHFRPSADPVLFHTSAFLFEEDFYTLGAYRRARRRYSTLVPWLHRLSAELQLSRDQARSLKVLYQSYCFQREAFAQILSAVRPSVVFGLHFILNPGFLSAIDETRTQQQRPVKLLIQHGHFGSGAFHDFKGADCVLLWGRYSEAVLQSGFLIPVPASRVVGNPKLEPEIGGGRMRMEKSASAQTEPPKMDIVFVSTPDAPGHDYHSRATRLVAKTMQGCPSSWHALFRPHPAERMDNYGRLVKEGLISPSQVSPRSAAIYELMHGADVVCGGNSTALLEAAAMGIPAIQILPEVSGTHWAEEGMTSASTEEELRNVLQGIFSDPEYCRNVLARQQKLVDNVFGRVSGAAENAAEYMESILARESGMRPVV